MAKQITGIQQVGIGIPDVHAAWAWYRKILAIDVPIFEEAAEANLMLPYTGGKPHQRHAILALSMQGGGGFEIWQYTSRKPQLADFEVQLGDLGINICKIKCHNAEQSHAHIKQMGGKILSEINKDPEGIKHFFVEDPYGNIFQIIESKNWFAPNKANTGGVAGVIIGVTNPDASLKLYRDILGYDTIVYDQTDVFDDLRDLNGGKANFRRLKLKHSKPRKGGFSELLGPTEIELVQVLDRKPVQIFKDRFWGDRGFIHLCFDIVNMKDLKAECEQSGFPFTVDSANSFDMGQAAGHFAYIEDPDGTLIEFVETHKIPILKKLGWYLDMRKRDAEKPLPKWMLKTLGFNRKRD